MTIWRTKSNSAPSGDPAIHVKYSGLWLSSDRKDQATDAVSRARYMVTYVAAVVSSLPSAQASGAVQDYGEYYFQTGGGLGQAELDIIRPVLVLIQNGLTQATNVKVISGRDGTAGYVNPHASLKKMRWTTGTKMRDRKGNLVTQRTVHRGDIHISARRLRQGIWLAAKTIIHEASHKFASTADFGKRGYTDDDSGLFWAAGLTADEALNNAESYARFVLHVFDDECGW
ncbi:hypothetical protein [Elioraea sp.]|uniref:hypothetical protein n=1 Tax=Elioraea sp. TaxID=2185103 RepID=UPI0025B7C6FE|nr:hypothetical protein [Elioraea sp.]